MPYTGGKNRLATRIIALFPKHTAYVEPFAGGAQVFFHKKPSRVEVLNDLNSEVVNFFRVCQSHYEELVRYLHFCLISRKWYELLSSANPEALTDVQRAGRFFYLQKNSFGGLVLKRRYHYGVVQPPNYNPRRIPETIANTHERLKGVQLECLPYEKILEKYDRPTTLFYLDPPYWDRKLYKFNFAREDYVGLNAQLRTVRGKFILSLNDHPEVRRLFCKFTIRKTAIAYTAQRRPGARYGELLIMNYHPARWCSKSKKEEILPAA